MPARRWAGRQRAVGALAERPDLLAGDAAILGEPTGALVEAGCQGTMRVRVTLRGVRAHTARPFTGRNAIHRLGPAAQRWPAGRAGPSCSTGAPTPSSSRRWRSTGGVAGNVVPDAASLTLNFRYAPDRDMAEAEAYLRQLLDGHVQTRTRATLGAHRRRRRRAAVAWTTPPGRAGGADRRRAPGQGGMDRRGLVLGARGPGGQLRARRPALAHHPDEHVTRAQLERAREVLAALIA
jgi:succinyl-diaminopimelate desuccinylase